MTEERILEILADYANAQEAAAVNVKHQIAEIVGVAEEVEYDPERIKWEEKEGPHGIYQRSTDSDNADFKMLLEALKKHSGKLTRDNFFYWRFRGGGLIIGRKHRDR